MALNVWTEKSGYSFGTFQERTTHTINLPVTSDLGVSYTVISGSLPGGLKIINNQIKGTPYEVARTTEFSFCIRASKNNEISDRTFKLTIEGPDDPIFLTNEGDLPIGVNDQYFVLDSSYVDFQIEAYDFDTAAGQKLSFFIADNEGELPPGLILTDDGRIVGFVQPVLSIKPEDGNGYYDTGAYDNIAFDWGYRSTNGYDSYIYDEVLYDFSVASKGPRKLNRNYEFIVTVTDGENSAKRRFKIFVVGDDYFRADNNTLLDGTGLFTADVTYLRAPIWITSSNLGIYRANNYVTLILDTYDTENVVYSLEYVNGNTYATSKQVLTTDNVVGSSALTIYNTSTIPTIGHYVTFSGLVIGATDELHMITNVQSIGENSYRLTLSSPLEVTIPDNLNFLIGTISLLPPGMIFDANTAEVHGSVPYQPAITTTYTFTVTAKRYSIKGEIARSSRIFTVRFIGEIDSVISWNTDSNLGAINANFVSTININASSTVPNAIVIYRKISGKLPPGLQLDLSGEIIGKVRQYGDSVTYKSFWKPNREYFLNDIVLYNDIPYKRILPYNLLTPENTFINEKWEQYEFRYNYRGYWTPLSRYSINDVVIYDNRFYKRISAYDMLFPETIFDLNDWEEFYEGLTTFSDSSTSTKYTNQSFDSGDTTIDRVYRFTVEARDQFGYSAITREFYITVDTPNQMTFSNLRVRPYLKLDQRSLWEEFINNTSIFTPSSIYRPNDSSFGIQKDLSMLVYAGVETTEAAAYVGAIGLNHKKKRFQFGSVKKAVAIIPGTKTQLYEVIYVEMIDPLEPDGKKLPQQISQLGKQTPQITVDKSNVIWQKGFTITNPITEEEQAQLDILEFPASWSERPEPIITADSSGYLSSGSNPNTYFPNSVSNWRKRLRSVGSVERNYLPLWMRSIQPGGNQELNFVLCVPLCYCKIGTGDDILLNIKFSEFDFKVLDYTVDRYIIDAVEGSTEDKYLVFRNDRITV